MYYNRVVYMQEAEKFFSGLDLASLSCAEVSGKLGSRYPFKSFEAFNYPEHDICAGPYRDEKGRIRKFDVIIADQVWEHLDRPYTATKNVLSMLNKGGYFYICVPFYVRYHAYPVDCSRWSARGLKNLLVEAGFDEDKIRSDQWGNRACGKREVVGRFAKYREGDPLENEPDYPIVAWAFAQK